MLINSPDNGATEVPGTTNNSLIVFMGGPIRYWWTPGVWGTRLHKLYMQQRDYLFNALSGHYLVYGPHRALRGPWADIAQTINNQAVLISDAMVLLQVEGVPAFGTQEEMQLGISLAKPILEVDIGDNYSVDAQIPWLTGELDHLAENLGRNV